eukprot:1176605-Prorocentrum_minimum.AAC.4
MYPPPTPIAVKEKEYTRRPPQSQSRKRNIPAAHPNRSQGKGIYQNITKRSGEFHLPFSKLLSGAMNSPPP